MSCLRVNKLFVNALSPIAIFPALLNSLNFNFKEKNKTCILQTHTKVFSRKFENKTA